MNQLAVTIIIILLPGIIATIMSDNLIVHSKWGSFEFGLYAFVLGTLTYALLQLGVYVYDGWQAVSFSNAKVSFSNANWHRLAIWNSAIADKPDIPGWEIVSAVFLSMPIALATAWLTNNKTLNRVAQKIGLTTKYGDENLYSYFLNADEVDWIYVRDPDRGLTYQGRVGVFSEAPILQA